MESVDTFRQCHYKKKCLKRTLTTDHACVLDMLVGGGQLIAK